MCVESSKSEMDAEMKAWAIDSSPFDGLGGPVILKRGNEMPNRRYE